MLLIDNIQFLGENVYGTGVKSIEKINTLIYPNPANDFIQLESESTILGVEIYSMLGQKVFTNQNIHENSYMLSTEQLESGMYMIRIRTDKGTAVEKVQVVR